MRRVFFDTNIVIDLLLARLEWCRTSSSIFDLATDGKIELYCSTLTLGTASFYLEKNHFTRDEIVMKLLNFVSVCMLTSVDVNVAKSALNSSFKDIEDAMQYFSALREGCDVIITRNKKDFAESKIQVLEPQEFLDKLCKEMGE